MNDKGSPSLNKTSLNTSVTFIFINFKNRNIKLEEIGENSFLDFEDLDDSKTDNGTLNGNKLFISPKIRSKKAFKSKEILFSQKNIFLETQKREARIKSNKKLKRLERL